MSTTADPRLSLLEGTARELARAAGFDAAERLMLHFGGQRVFVPRRMRPRSPLFGALGREAALKLAELFGGEYIEVPIGKALSTAKRLAAIASFKGSHNEAARAFGCTRRWVRMVRAGARPDLRQAGLFDKPSKGR